MKCIKCKQHKKPEEMYYTLQGYWKTCLKCKANQREERVLRKKKRQILFIEKFNKETK